MQELVTGNYSGNIIHQSGVAGLICSHTAYLTGTFNRERHYHQNAHLSLVMNGTCIERKKHTEIRGPGHVTFYHAGEPHEVKAVSSNSRHINIELSSSFIKRHGLQESSIEKAVKQPGAGLQLLRIYHDRLTADAITAEGTAFLLLEMLAGPAPATATPAWVAIIDEYLRDNFTGTLSLTELAAVAGTHPVTLSKYFRRYFGCTLSEYLRRLKAERALSLIRQHKLSLTEVAYRSGFADQSHFTRTFKQLTGMLPGDYKKI